MILMPESEERDYALVENGEVTRVERMDEESAMLTNSILRMTGEEKRWMRTTEPLPAKGTDWESILGFIFGLSIVIVSVVGIFRIIAWFVSVTQK
jgi:hypothetical protein